MYIFFLLTLQKFHLGKNPLISFKLCAIFKLLKKKKKKSNWFIVFVSLYRTISGRWVIHVLVDLALKYSMIEFIS